ncbi:hypothetical protein CY34DRAFT_161014 [Suillus luteus UH-Slu-Lm8-n1]|uniref:Uncharacterized protein n=1 Tax=Suillus luteus UH-Slu-Lm8-n1 TaxID=930992 RepID=A0A0D0AW99_9AGAM|nr:hypothetical protein CY34DRAFT_161014 [Suillus luteus UH-Slu-Lm8-n1]
MIALGCDIYMIVASALCFEDQTHDGKQKPHQTTLCIRYSAQPKTVRGPSCTYNFNFLSYYLSHCRYVNKPNGKVSFAKTILEVRIYVVDCVSTD